jgi:hypothetical protein
MYTVDDGVTIMMERQTRKFREGIEIMEGDLGLQPRSKIR